MKTCENRSQTYPTLLFLDANGEVLHKSEGLVNADILIEKGKEAVLKYKTESKGKER